MKAVNHIISILLFSTLVLTACGESKENLRERIDELETQVYNLEDEIRERDERIQELEEKLDNVSSYSSNLQNSIDNIHYYGNRYGDLDDAEDAASSITDEAYY